MIGIGGMPPTTGGGCIAMVVLKKLFCAAIAEIVALSVVLVMESMVPLSRMKSPVW
jgi:hypothetical protein